MDRAQYTITLIYKIHILYNMNNTVPALTFFFTLLLIPAIPPNFADTNVDEAHNIATQKMIQRHINLQFGASNSPPVNATANTPSYIPIIFSAVDNDTLVVGIDARVLSENITYTEQQIADYIGINASIDIKYMSISSDSLRINSNENLHLEFLADICHPIIALDFEDKCVKFFTELTAGNVLTKNNPLSGQNSPSMNNPCDDSLSSLACYFYNQYIAKCIPTYTRSRCASYAAFITNGGYTLPTSSTISDTVPPVITIPDDIVKVVSGTSAYVDYQVSATDNVDETVSVTCNPSNNVFPLGTTRVTCSSMDTSQNTARESFTVTVTQNTLQSSDTVVFSDDFENGLSKWVVSGELRWRTGQLDENVAISGHTISNNVAEADDCDRECILEMRNGVDLSDVTSATLEFYRFVDNSLDRGEYLKVEAYDGTSWNQLAIYGDDYDTNDDAWHFETLDISDYTNSDFKVRFIVLASSRSEDVGVDEIAIRIRTSVTDLPTIFSDDFENGLSKWTKTGDYNWNDETLDDGVIIDGFDISNLVAQADNCDNVCFLTMAQSVDFSSASSKSLIFDRFVDSSLDRNEYLRVDAYDGISWTYLETYGDNNNKNDKEWHNEIIDLSAYTNDDFKIRFVAQTSKSSEEVAVDNIQLKTGDSISTIQLSNITVYAAEHESKRVSYNLNAQGAASDVTVIRCDPPSGSIFSSTTSVECIVDSIYGPFKYLFTVFFKPPVEIYGGTPHVFYPSPTANGSAGTITTGVTTTNGHHGVVVAGHTINAPRNFYEPTHVIPLSHNLDDLSNTVVFSTLNGIGTTIGNYDAAFIRTSNSDTTAPLNHVRMLNGTIFTVTHGTLSDVEVLSTINIYGQYNNRDGLLIFKNATLDNTRGTLTEMGIGNYKSIDGDSGGPIVYHGDGAVLVGLHGGSVCIFTPEDANTIDVSNSSFCNSNIIITSQNGDYHNVYYKYFSAWENVKNGLNVR